MTEHDYETFRSSGNRWCVICGHVAGTPDVPCVDARETDPACKDAGWRALNARAERTMRANSDARRTP